MTVLIVCGVLGTATPAASEDHDTARRALEHGEIRPLDQIIASVKSNVTGNIVSVEIEHFGPAWDYELRVLDRDGRIRRVTVDARSAQILKIEHE